MPVVQRVSDVAEGMAGDFHDVECATGYFDVLALADPKGGGGDAIVVGAITGSSGHRSRSAVTPPT